jgi:hypothetical protein
VGEGGGKILTTDFIDYTDLTRGWAFERVTVWRVKNFLSANVIVTKFVNQEFFFRTGPAGRCVLRGQPSSAEAQTPLQICVICEICG